MLSMLFPTFFKKCYRCDGFSNSCSSMITYALPLFALILYSFFGGWLFSTLESSFGANSSPIVINDSNLIGNKSANDQEFIHRSYYDRIIDNLTDFLDISRKSVNYSTPRDFLLETSHKYKSLFDNVSTEYQLRARLKRISHKLASGAWKLYMDEKRTMERFVEGLIIDSPKFAPLNQSEAEEKSTSHWDIWQSTLFAATLYTTIGYGNIAPVTSAGRVCAILYSVFGIPLVLIVLRLNGTALFNGLKLVNRLTKRSTSLHRPYKPIDSKQLGPIDSVDDQSSVSSSENDQDLPIYLSLLLVTFWICFCAGLFLLWEDDWNYFTSWYFFFITMTTIGLGDVVPKYPQYTLLAFMLVIFGLSAVSTTFNIIQMNVEKMFDSIVKGIDAEYKLKQTDPTASRMIGRPSVPVSERMSHLYHERSWRERIFFRFLMDEHRKNMLESYYEKKSNTRNATTQTPPTESQPAEIQCHIEEEEIQSGRKYIYNLKD